MLFVDRCVWRVLAVVSLSNVVALPLKVRLVTPGLTGLSVLATVTFNGPAFAAALDNLRRDYPAMTFTQTYLYDRSITDCVVFADVVQTILARWYYSQKVCDECVTVIVAPGCAESFYLNQLAAAWNILLVTTTSSDPVLRDKTKSPTWITTNLLPSSYYGDMLYQLLLKQHWTSVYYLVDEDAVTFYQNVAHAFERIMSTSNTRLRRFSYSSKKPNFDYNSTLTDFSHNSRIFVFLGSAAQFHDLLLAANRLDLLHDSYVYIGLELYPYKPQGLFTWSMQNDNDDVLRAAYRNVILVTAVDVARIQTDQLADLQEAWMTKLRTTPFFENTDLHVEPPIPQLAAANSAIEILGQVLNETLSDAHSSWQDGGSLARRFHSRTFNTRTGQVVLDHNGERAPFVKASAFDFETGLFKVFLQSDVTHGVFRWTQITEPVWFNVSRLPPNEPPCGYTAPQYGCVGAETFSSLDVTLATAFSILILLCGSASGCYYYTLSQKQMDLWWMLSRICLECD